MWTMDTRIYSTEDNLTIDIDEWEGRHAFWSGKPKDACPHMAGARRTAWIGGWESSHLRVGGIKGWMM